MIIIMTTIIIIISSSVPRSKYTHTHTHTHTHTRLSVWTAVVTRWSHPGGAASSPPALSAVTHSPGVLVGSGPPLSGGGVEGQPRGGGAAPEALG